MKCKNTCSLTFFNSWFEYNEGGIQTHQNTYSKTKNNKKINSLFSKININIIYGFVNIKFLKFVKNKLTYQSKKCYLIC